MAEALEIATPWGWPNAGAQGTSPADFQRVLATMFEYHPSRSGGTTRAGIYRGGALELHADATLGYHDGSVILDAGSNRVVWAPLSHTANVPHDLPVGQAGTITVYVQPPTGSSVKATVRTTTSSTIGATWVVLDRITLPNGWTRTNQGTSNWDKEFAVLQGTSNGEISSALDTDASPRVDGNRYRRLNQNFSLATDANVSLSLSTTIRSIWEDGTGMAHPLEWGITGSVFYAVYVDGVLLTTVERTISGFTTTEAWEFTATLSAGNHTAYVESYGGSSIIDNTDVNWRVMFGGSAKHRGDFLRVKNEGVRR